jgi:hypothetical protein
MANAPQYDQNQLYQALMAAQNRLSKSGEQEDAAYGAASSFDPSKAFTSYADAGLQGVKSQLGTELDSLAGKAAGSGRLNTGFYDLDQGDVARNIYGDYGRGVQQAALQTTGMQQQNNMGLLNYAADKRNSYLDLLTANQDRATAQKNSKKGFWGTLGDVFKTGASVAGSII